MKMATVKQSNKCGQGREKLEPLCTVGGNVNGKCGKQSEGSSKMEQFHLWVYTQKDGK